MAERTMTERPDPAWWPSSIVDEVMPPGKSSPEDWMEHNELVTPSTDYDTGREISVDRSVADGEIVDFVSESVIGTATLTMRADGTWTCDASEPPGTNSVYCEDVWGVVGGDIADLAEQLTDEADDYAITFSSFVTHRLRWNATTQRFEPAGQAQ